MISLRSINRWPNFHRLDNGSLSVWFSYETPIAFHVTDHPLVIRQNEWKTTTGRHLNYIDPDHKIRISGEKFLEMLEAVLNAKC